jgi:hypothetical protein
LIWDSGLRDTKRCAKQTMPQGINQQPRLREGKMRATKIYFERTKSLPGFCNRKVGIEVQLEKGEKANDAMKKAELFVAGQLGESLSPQQKAMAFEVVKSAEEEKDLPF